MLTTEQINEAVQAAMPDVLAGLRREIAETALAQAKQATYNAVQKAVTEWTTENLIPEIIASLTAEKEGLVSIAPQIAASLSDELAKSLRESIAKKLESSWERKKLFEALIG